MSTRRFIALAACLTVTVAALTQDEAVQVISLGIDRFSSSYYSQVSFFTPNNVVSSPLSASIVLAMAAYGSRGSTEEEFGRIIHLPEKAVSTPGYGALIDSFNAIKNVELHLSNNIFIGDNFSIKPTYRESIETVFKSTAQNVNFANKKAALNTINQLVEQQTNNHIKDPLTPDVIADDTRMVLISAAYFKGTLAMPFDPSHTTNKPFHLTKDLIKNVPTMHNTGTYRYGALPQLEASFVELPYKGGELSMIIILPNKVDGLAELEEKLTYEELTELVKQGHKTGISLYLPKFKIESTLNLNQHVQNMGIEMAFTIRHADFSDISDTAGIYIDSVVQKSFIEVNEQGSEPVSATADAINTPRDDMKYVPFVIDHPFFYSIIRTEDGKDNRAVVPVFKGHVTDPQL